jgi:phage-related tail protein
MGVDRMKRILAAGSVALLAALSVGHADEPKSDVREIRIIESGGSSGVSIDAAYGKPFTEAWASSRRWSNPAM